MYLNVNVNRYRYKVFATFPALVRSSFISQSKNLTSTPESPRSCYVSMTSWMSHFNFKHKHRITLSTTSSVNLQRRYSNLSESVLVFPAHFLQEICYEWTFYLHKNVIQLSHSATGFDFPMSEDLIGGIFSSSGVKELDCTVVHVKSLS